MCSNIFHRLDWSARKQIMVLECIHIRFSIQSWTICIQIPRNNWRLQDLYLVFLYDQLICQLLPLINAGLNEFIRVNATIRWLLPKGVLLIGHGMVLVGVLQVLLRGVLLSI